MFTIAAGNLPAVESGILPGGNGVWSGKALTVRHLRPGGKMPPSTAARMAAATHLRPTVNTYPSWEGSGVGWLVAGPWTGRKFLVVLSMSASAQRRAVARLQNKGLSA